MKVIRTIVVVLAALFSIATNPNAQKVEDIQNPANLPHVVTAVAVLVSQIAPIDTYDTI